MTEQTSHSHPVTKQDLWVLSKSDGPGTFIELGGYDGLTHSNTLLLEQQGWRGHLIEAFEPFFELCQRNRPLAHVHHAVIGYARHAKLVIGGQYTGLVDTMPDAFMREHEKRHNEVIPVIATPLQFVVRDEFVDYLSVDTEGGEFEIIEGWFKANRRARLVTVEFRYDSDEFQRLSYLMDQYGYDLDEVRGFDLCFTRRPGTSR